MAANTFLSFSGMPWSSHVVMITSNSIHISQEIFAIDVLTALKSSLEQGRKHVLGLLRLYGDQAYADQCKEQFFWSHNKQVLFAVFAGSHISINLSHKSNTVPGSGPGSQTALAAVGPRIIKSQSEKKRIMRQSVESWKKH